MTLKENYKEYISQIAPVIHENLTKAIEEERKEEAERKKVETVIERTAEVSKASSRKVIETIFESTWRVTLTETRSPKKLKVTKKI